MKRDIRLFNSRKARKKALHIRQYGSANNAPASAQAMRMIGGSTRSALSGSIGAIAAAIMSIRRGGGNRNV